MLICPICNKTLEKIENCFKCEENHSFDISKSSYTNLLVKNKPSDEIGDNKNMVCARTEFLNRNYYKKLADFLAEKVFMLSPKSYIDLGCGQGYYTKNISNSIENSYGTDISKHAVLHASKHDKNTMYFVSSVFNLPIADKSIDVGTCIFSPLALEEYNRILIDDGTLFVVVAGDNHLIELKNEIYEKAYTNDEDKYDFKTFKVTLKEKLTYTETFDNNLDIKHLFNMTPYSFKTSIQDTKKLDKIESLDITMDFAIYTLKKY